MAIMSLETTGASRNLPDAEVCRGQDAGFGDYVDCLVAHPNWCPHVLRFGDGHFCLHPERREIVRKSVAAPEA